MNKANNPIVLMYHGITGKNDAVANFDGKHIEAAKFEQQLQYLLKHYSIISIDDFLGWRVGKKKLPKNPVILTFDDGYANCYTQLFHLLKKYNIPATIFLLTQHIGKKDPAWYDAITYCIAYTKERKMSINTKKYSFKTEKEKFATLVVLKKVVLGSNQRDKLIREIAQAMRVDPKKCQDEDFLFCSWEQCQEMKEDKSAKITFGSHSVTHQLMTGLSETEIEKEVQESKKIIEKRLKEECNAFSYPFGSSNEMIRGVIEKSGYSCGFSTTYGKNTKETDVHVLKRIALNNLYDLPIFSLTLFFNFPLFHHWLLKQWSQIKKGF